MKRLLAIAIVLLPSAAFAHKPSDSYLTLRPGGSTVEARWDIAVRDLAMAVGAYTLARLAELRQESPAAVPASSLRTSRA